MLISLAQHLPFVRQIALIMFVQFRKLLRPQLLSKLFSSQQVNSSAQPAPAVSISQSPEQNASHQPKPSATYQDVDRLITNQYDFLKFQSLFRRCQIDHSQPHTAHQELPENQARKLQIIQEYMDSLTPEELRYLQYQLAHDVKRKRHNSMYSDPKREYYYELAFFGRKRSESLQKIMMAGKQSVLESIK